MKLIITHKKTKRIIEGPFSICCGREQLELLKSVIDKTLEEGFTYGWININEEIVTADGEEYEYSLIRRQKSIDQTEASPWD
jgi:hypothetical protein